MLSLKHIVTATELSRVDTGFYASSWQVDDSGMADNEIAFGNTAPYAEILEFGHPPFKVNWDAILQWVMRIKKSSKVTPEIVGFAKYVSKKLETVGLKPNYTMKKVIDKHIIPDITKALQQKFKNFSKKLIIKKSKIIKKRSR